MSFGHPQLTHSHLTRKAGIYYFRRRLPPPHVGEIGLSLRTRLYREAEHLAHLLDRRLMDDVAAGTARVDLVPILRTYLEELRSSYRDDHRSTPTHRSVFGLPTGGEDPVDIDLAYIDEMVGELRERIGRRSWKEAGESLAALMSAHRVPESQRIELAEGILAADAQALRELRERLLGNVSPFDGAPVAPSDKAAVPQAAGQPLSSVVEPFLAAMAQKRVKPWPEDDVRKARAAYALFQGFCGDRPLGTYQRSDVYDFYRALAQLPKHHGKSPKDRHKTMRELIASATGTRLTAKTVEGYASRMVALFDRHRDENDPGWINPAEGFGKFDEIGEASSARKMWDGEPLRKLFRSPVWTGSLSEARPKRKGAHVFANEKYWLPILALYQGARLEELARLVRQEIAIEDGVTYLNITDEDPPGAELERKKGVKTAAAKRRVPLHEAVLDLGFLRYVEYVAPNPGDFIFPRLKANRRKGDKRSEKFSQWFTMYRRYAGITDDGYVFHSFRASVATKLLSVSPGVPVGHIVALIGHESEIAAAVNAPTLVAHYLKSKQISLADLQGTINAVHYPGLVLPKPTTFSDGTSFIG